MSHPAQAYRQISVRGATPLSLVVMLYVGAIASMQRAACAIEANDVQQKCTDLNRALAIIAQLEGTLNFELGGEVAQTLKALYVYARTEMLRANLENSPQTLRGVIEKLATVREAWYEADHRVPVPATVSAREGFVGGTPPDPPRGPEPLPFERTLEKSPYAPSPAVERRAWDLSA
jgi:flagellar secretion chaperone FliS